MEAILKAAQEKEHRWFKFQASLKGVDLDGDGEEKEDPVVAAKRRANAQLTGKTVEELDMDSFGIEYETM